MTEYRRFFETENLDSFLNPNLNRFDPDYTFIEDFLVAVRRNDESRLDKLLSEPLAAYKEIKSTQNTVLHFAARFGSIELVERLLKLGRVHNYRDRRGRTPLYRATVRSAEMVQLFLDNGANINCPDNQGVTVLHRALLSGSVKVVMVLLKKKLNLNQNLDDGPRDDFEECRKIVQLCHDVEIDLHCRKFVYNYNYDVLLFFIGKYGDEETFKQVLSTNKDKRFFNINAKNRDEHTLLHVLVDAGRIDFVKEILESGADVNMVGSQKYTALHYSIMRNNPSMVRLLIDYEADAHGKCDSSNVPLLYAIVSGNIEIVEILLTASVDINKKIGSGFIIHQACGSQLLIEPLPVPEFALNYCNREAWSGSTLKMIKYLIKKGADINVRNTRGLTPVLAACKAGRLNTVKCLLNFGSKLNLTDQYGNDALYHAVSGKNIDLVDFLLCNGFDIKSWEASRSLFHNRFLEYQDTLDMDMIEFLADNGADINVPATQKGWNLLQYAMSIDKPDFLVGLLELKAIIEVPSNWEKESPYSPKFSDFKTDTKCSRQVTAFLAMKGVDISLYIIQDEDVNSLGIYSTVKSYYHKCQSEIEQMKLRRICGGRRVSYFDFVSKELLDVVPFTNSEELMKVLESGGYKEEFPCYALMLEQRIMRVKKLRNDVDLIKKFLQKDYAKQTLPLIVLGEIFSFWNVGNVRNFGRALSLKKK